MITVKTKSNGTIKCDEYWILWGRVYCQLKETAKVIHKETTGMLWWKRIEEYEDEIKIVKKEWVFPESDFIGSVEIK